jgi:hypothetical protein
MLIKCIALTTHLLIWTPTSITAIWFVAIVVFDLTYTQAMPMQPTEVAIHSRRSIGPISGFHLHIHVIVRFQIGCGQGIAHIH